MARRNLTPAEIGDIVRTTRRAASLRQDELAGAAGVGLRFIVDLEAGKPTAQVGKVLQVLAALGCSIDITPPPEARTILKARFTKPAQAGTKALLASAPLEGVDLERPRDMGREIDL